MYCVVFTTMLHDLYFENNVEIMSYLHSFVKQSMVIFKSYLKYVLEMSVLKSAFRLDEK